MDNLSNYFKGKTKNDKMIIAENEKWFKWFLLLPDITTSFFILACAILGFIFTAVNDEAIFLLIFWGGGAVFCALNYLFMKIILSYNILHIYYLKKISSYNFNSVLKSSSTNEVNKLPEI